MFSITRQTWVLYPCFSPLQNVVLYSPTACVARNLPLSRVNAILQFLGLGAHTTTMLVPVSDRDKIKEAACIRFQQPLESKELGFLTYFSTDIYLHLLITLCSQFCRCSLSNRGDKFSNPLYVKGTGCFLKVPCKFQICEVQVHYQYIINIKLVPRRSFGNMAKSTFSAFTPDDGFEFSINLLAESSSSGRKIDVTGKKHTVFKCTNDPMKPLKQWRLVNVVIEVSKYICAIN